jgi:hypothetical protein
MLHLQHSIDTTSGPGNKACFKRPLYSDSLNNIEDASGVQTEENSDQIRISDLGMH